MKVFDIALVPTYFEFAKRGTVFFVDTETTGLEDTDDVVQLAVVEMKDGEVVDSQAKYLMNRTPINGTEAQKVNGLTDEFLAEKGLPPQEVLSGLLLRLNKTIQREGRVLLAAHNLAFDLRMLENMMKRYECGEIPNGTIGCCTRDFVKAVGLPKSILPGNHLRYCIKAFHLDADNSHDALDDTMACLHLFKFLTED